MRHGLEYMRLRTKRPVLPPWWTSHAIAERECTEARMRYAAGSPQRVRHPFHAVRTIRVQTVAAEPDIPPFAMTRRSPNDATA